MKIQKTRSILKEKGRGVRQYKSYLISIAIFSILFFSSFTFSSALPNDAGNSIDFTYPETINYSLIPTVNSSNYIVNNADDTTTGKLTIGNTDNPSEAQLVVRSGGEDTGSLINFPDVYAGGGDFELLTYGYDGISLTYWGISNGAYYGEIASTIISPRDATKNVILTLKNADATEDIDVVVGQASKNASNLIVYGNATAKNHIDFTDANPLSKEQTWENYKGISSGVDGKINHSTLSDFVKTIIPLYDEVFNETSGKNETQIIGYVEGRIVNNQVTENVDMIQQLIGKVELLETENNMLKGCIENSIDFKSMQECIR